MLLRTIMSKQVIETTFQGFKQICINLDQLNEAYDSCILSTFYKYFRIPKNDGFECVTEKGYKVSELGFSLTDDGYTWLCGFTKISERGKIVFLFPYMNDKLKKDGLKLDRSIGIYASGDVNKKEILKISETFT